LIFLAGVLSVIYLLIKTWFLFFVMIWLRGAFPRLRVDQLMAFAWKFLLPISIINVLVVGGEVLLWQEADLDSAVAIPLFAVINAGFAVAAIVGWATVLGHTSPQRTAHRATLTQEVGAIFYREAAPNP
jgi:hypothetical protein